ncbi:MAG: DUF2508 family protein [Zhaonellaceae bacterium]|jgi:hypothetical protein
MVCFKKYFNKPYGRVDGRMVLEQDNPEFTDPLEKELWKAKVEWDNACNYFNQVADPDLVDYAVFEMEAAERKYMHLLNIIKKEQGYLREQDEVTNVREEHDVEKKYIAGNQGNENGGEEN